MGVTAAGVHHSLIALHWTGPRHGKQRKEHKRIKEVNRKKIGLVTIPGEMNTLRESLFMTWLTMKASCKRKRLVVSVISVPLSLKKSTNHTSR